MKKSTIFFALISATLFCNAQQSLQFTETFSASSPSISTWDYSNSGMTIVVQNPDVGSPASPLGSLMYNFYNGMGNSTYHVISPLLDTPAQSSVKVTFDFAAANRYTMPAAIQTVFADDHILLEFSLDGGTTYELAKDYEIGRFGELNTGGTISSFFTPNATQWVTKSYLLPPGTNRVKFKGVKNLPNQAGNFAYLDNVMFEACNTPAPTGSSVQSFCSGESVSLLDVTGSNLQYYLTDVGGNALAPTTALTDGTTYYVSQTINGCESYERFIVTAILGDCLSVEEAKNSANKIEIFPNPVEANIMIKSNHSILKVEIVDASGRMLREIKNSGIKSIDVADLIKGKYFINLYSKDFSSTHTFIKK